MVNIEDIIEYFKTEFESLMKNFGDTRQVNYSLYDKSNKGLVDCNWSRHNININFKIIPINYYLTNPAHVELFNDNPDMYRNYFIQVARHEYGHSISCESFHKLHSYILSSKVYFECRINNYYFKVYLNDIFYDFIANYLVYEKIDRTIPEEHIIINLHSFQTTFTAGYGIFGLIKTCLLLSQVFYIYTQWDKLNPVFNDFNIIVFLDFLYVINDTFNKIILKNTHNEWFDIDSAITDIMNLAEILDNINWKQLVLENHYDSNGFDLLDNYRRNI